jgi:hypothetical protein
MWPGALIGTMGSLCGSGLAFWSVRVGLPMSGDVGS